MKGRITKIKARKGEYTFSWEIYQENTKNWDKHTLVCKDQPREELKERLQVMANHVTDICEFEQGATKNIVVSGITITYTDDNRYLVITALKDLKGSKAPLVINTPVRPELPESDCDAEFCMSDELLNDLQILEEEAWLYINGDRAQIALKFDEKQEADKEAEDVNPAGGSEHEETRAA